MKHFRAATAQHPVKIGFGATAAQHLQTSRWKRSIARFFIPVSEVEIDS